MKIALLGGGGFRVPMVYGALLDRCVRLGIDEVTLYDIDERRLDRIGPVLEGLARERGVQLPFRPTLDLDDALDGADFIFAAIRVGQLEGRVIDELVPLEEGVVGQETTGPGGICFALRTVPEMVRIAERVAVRAPAAWFVNFTNPAGLVTEALQQVLGARVLGVCDSPTSLFREVAAALDRPVGALRFDYFGLNHLGWLRGVYDGDRDLMPALLADDERLATFEAGQLFGGEWLRSIGMIPNEYMYFYYFSSDTVAALRSGVEPRAEFLLRQQAAFYAAESRTPEEALTTWRATRREREGNYFAEARTAAGLPGLHGDGLDTGGLRGGGDGGRGGNRHGRGPRARHQHGEPRGAAVPGRLRRGRGAVRRDAGRRLAPRRRRRARPCPGAHRGGEGRGAPDDSRRPRAIAEPRGTGDWTPSTRAVCHYCAPDPGRLLARQPELREWTR